jgi:hypothetical protein
MQSFENPMGKSVDEDADVTGSHSSRRRGRAGNSTGQLPGLSSRAGLDLDLDLDETPESATTGHHGFFETIHRKALHSVAALERLTGCDLDGDGVVAGDNMALDVVRRVTVTGQIQLSFMHAAADGERVSHLCVVVHRAKELRDMDGMGKNDAYCVVLLNGEEQVTSVVKDGGSAPVWHKGDHEGGGEMLQFDWSAEQQEASAGLFFIVQVWDEDYHDEDDLIGAVHVPFDTVTGEMQTKWFTIKDVEFDVNNFFKTIEDQAYLARQLAEKIPFCMFCLKLAIKPSNQLKLVRSI